MIKTRRLHAGAPHNSGGHITHTALILLAIGCVYWFLAEFPLRARESWAWWTFFVSGICGLASFLTYLAYGYLDTWHGIATLFLLPVFAEDYGRPARQRSRRVQERLGLLPSEPVPEANALGRNPFARMIPVASSGASSPLSAASTTSFRTAMIRTLMETAPSPRASRATRQAAAVALVKAGWVPGRTRRRTRLDRGCKPAW